MAAADAVERRVRMRDGVDLWTSSSWVTDEDDDGEGRPALVLVHGGPGLWDHLEPVAASVADLVSTHRYDQRGCGRSDPSDVQTIARAVADLEELRDAFGHERWTVFGHSFGAAIATRYAAAHPSRVSAVVWCAGTGPDWPSQRAEAKARMADRLTAAEWGEHRRLGELGQRGRTWEQEVRWRTLQWLPDHPAPATAATVAAVEAFATTPLPVNEHANHSMAVEEFGRDPAEALDELAGIDVPVLIIRGAEDPRPAIGTLTVAEALPHAELVVIDGAGHLPWEDRPAEYASALRRFVQAHA
ncbi:alpha/beta fold hydrolase [Quadrisphaera setariae]|uniref:alpha/beta fold hydrolase n=1 Tax=Quadrisphaera setariae TaxID=2593304 RepID=UPI0016503AA5|nr:alpha/beta hydrolase [Quadrisphaera setariae]